MKTYNEEHYLQFEKVIINAIRRTGVHRFYDYEDCMQEGRIVYLGAYEKYDTSYDRHFGMFLKVALEWKYIGLIRKAMRWGSIDMSWSLDDVDLMGEAFINRIESEIEDAETTFFIDEQLYYLDDYFYNSEYKAVYELMQDGYNQHDIGVLLGMSQPSVSREIAKIKEMTQRYFEFGDVE